MSSKFLKIAIFSERIPIYSLQKFILNKKSDNSRVTSIKAYNDGDISKIKLLKKGTKCSFHTYISKSDLLGLKLT